MRKTPSENIVGKGENAGYQHFLLLPQCFPTDRRQKFILTTFIVCKSFEFGQVQKLSFGKQLIIALFMNQLYTASENITGILGKKFTKKN